MLYLIYKITNKLDNKIYIGSHKTNNIDDSYMGSGKYLNHAYNKHGIENFIKEILFVFDNATDMYDKEAELVDVTFLTEENTYNLKQGGFGGFDYINQNKLNFSTEQNRKISPFANPTRYDDSWHIQTTARRNAGIKKAVDEGRWSTFNSDINVDMCKRAQTPAAKAKRIETLSKIKHQQGNANSQFGTMWITDGTSNKKVKKDIVIPDGWNKGRTI